MGMSQIVIVGSVLVKTAGTRRTIEENIQASKGPQRNEIASLLASLVIKPSHDAGHWLRWSAWRRRH
jgi:hypothetical protein